MLVDLLVLVLVVVELLVQQQQQQQQHLIQELYKHLSLTLGSDIRDKSACDVALNLSFCCSPILSDDATATTITTTLHVVDTIFDILVQVSTKEIQRKSKRKTKISELMQVVEKIVASGCCNTRCGSNRYVQNLFDTILDIVDSKGDDDTNDSELSLSPSSLQTIQQLKDGTFSTTSSRSILWLYRRYNALYPRITEHDLQYIIGTNRLTSRYSTALQSIY